MVAVQMQDAKITSWNFDVGDGGPKSDRFSDFNENYGSYVIWHNKAVLTFKAFSDIFRC